MYPYHNLIKKRIKKGELIKIERSKDSRFAFNLIFSTPPYVRPIRHHSVYRYLDLLDKYDLK